MKKSYFLKAFSFAFTLILIFALQFSYGQTGNVYSIGLDGGESFGVNDGNNALDVSNQWTFEAWINVSSHVASNYECIMDRRTVFSFYLVDDDDNDYAITFGARNSSDAIIASVDCDGSGSTSANMTYDTWYHVATTFDGITAKLFVNGIECDSDTDTDWPLTASTNAINIGGRYWSGYSRQMSNAVIDEIRVSNIARNIATMQSSASWEEYTSDNNTVLLMHLNDNSDDSPSYVSGTDLNGSSFNDGITSIDYITPSDNLLRPNYRSKATGNWNAPATWSFYNGSSWSDASLVPGEYTPEVNILGGFTVTEPGDLTINSNTSLTIEDDGNLTVSGILTNDGTLTIQSNEDGDGSLKFESGTPNATVQRYIVQYSDDDHGWHLLGSPVATFAIDGSPFDPGDDPSPNDFYRWEETTGLWMNYKNGDPTQIIPGTGYLTAWEATDTKEFSGALNNSDITKSNLSYTSGETYQGAHLLGNPFPSAIKWKDGNWALTGINEIAKVWNETNASYSDIGANGIIPSANGFMVEATSATNSITIPTAARVHDGTAWYKNTEHYIKLIAHDLESNTAQETNIRINGEATNTYDPLFDSHFFKGFAPSFYSLNDEHALSTNTFSEINEDLEISLGFVKNDASQFTIELDLEKLMPDTDVFLTDNKTGTSQDMVNNPVYQFTSFEGDDPNRFVLKFSETSAIGKPGMDEDFIVYTANGTVYINSTLNLNGEIRLVDLSGRTILTSELIDGNGTISTSGNFGFCIINIVTDKGVVNKKVLVN
jgi:hypothetical protein